MSSNDAAEEAEVTLGPSDSNKLSLDTAILDAVTTGTHTMWTSFIMIESTEVMLLCLNFILVLKQLPSRRMHTSCYPMQCCCQKSNICWFVGEILGPETPNLHDPYI